MKRRPSFPDLPGKTDKRRKLSRFTDKEKERLKKEELKPGMLVKMFNMRARGFAVVLNYPFENTVEVLDPNGDIHFTHANYLMPVKNESRRLSKTKRVLWSCDEQDCLRNNCRYRRRRHGDSAMVG